MTVPHQNYRRELVFACFVLAFAAGVVYDTRFILPYEGMKSLIAAGVVGCFGMVFLLTAYPRAVIQPALLAAWPLHLYTICFLGVSWCFHGGAQKAQIIAYTIVAYATWLLVPVCLLMERRLFDGFIKLVGVGSAVLAIPSYIGAAGIDQILGANLSNKYSYSGFSGIVASGGIFEHAEGHALQMAIGLFCCVWAFRKTGKPFYGICTLMVLLGLFISQGRGAIFGVLIAAAYFVLPEIFRRSRLLFLGSFAFCLLFPFMIWPQLAKVPGVADYLRMERGLSGRDVAWLYAITLIEEEPLSGHGFGTSSNLSEDAWRELRRSGYSGAGTTFHNTFITKAVELGILTTVVYALMYLMALIRICEPTEDVLGQHLVRSIVVVTLTASIFRDYNVGGVRSTSILVAVFLGLANLWPLSERFAALSHATTEVGSQWEHLRQRVRDGRRRSVPGQSGS